MISLILNPDPDPDPQILLSTDPDPMLPLTSDHFLVEFVTFPTKVHKNSLNRVNFPEKYALASLNWGETETSTEILFEFKLSNCQSRVEALTQWVPEHCGFPRRNNTRNLTRYTV